MCTDPQNGSMSHLDDFLGVLATERGLSPNTIAAYRRDISFFQEFLGTQPATGELVEHYVDRLHRDGMRRSTIARKLAAIRSFYRFLVAEGRLQTDPTQLIETPRAPLGLPKALDIGEAIRLMEAPRPDTPLGRRDRALLETLYGAALRVGELVNLDLHDLDLETRSALVSGKGSRQRIVLLGGPGVSALQAYLPDRLTLRGERHHHDAVFVNARGGRLTRQGAFGIVRKHGASIGIPPTRLSPHVLRHSAATHMVQGGADLRSVQEFLGHASLNTTQVYTRMSLRHLREVYVEAHPRALI